MPFRAEREREQQTQSKRPLPNENPPSAVGHPVPVVLNAAIPPAAMITPESGHPPQKAPLVFRVAGHVAKLVTPAPARVSDRPEAIVWKDGLPFTAGRAFIEVGREMEPTFFTQHDLFPQLRPLLEVGSQYWTTPVKELPGGMERQHSRLGLRNEPGPHIEVLSESGKLLCE